MSNSVDIIINELSNKIIENLFISKIAVVRKLQENGINNLYQLIASQNEILSYSNSKFTDLQKKSIIAVISKEVNDIYKYEKSTLYSDKEDFTLCFSSDILDIFISNISMNSHNENGSINPFIIRYVSKSKNRYVFIKHDDFKTKICYDDTIDEQLEIGREKYIEFTVYIHNKVYYKFVLKFDCFGSKIEGFSRISCFNSIQTKEDLNAVEYWPQNIKNKKKESLEFLYNIGVLNATDLKKCINSLYINDDWEFQEAIDDDLLDIDDDLVDLDSEFSDIDDDLDGDLCDFESNTENASYHFYSNIHDSNKISFTSSTNASQQIDNDVNSDYIYQTGDVIYNANNVCILYCGVSASKIHLFVINNNDKEIKLSSIRIKKYGKLFAYLDDDNIKEVYMAKIEKLPLNKTTNYSLFDLGTVEITIDITNDDFFDRINININAEYKSDDRIMGIIDKHIYNNNLKITLDIIDS